MRFGNERAVEDGPVREFFSILMGMVQYGFPLEVSKLTLVFEEQTIWFQFQMPFSCSSGFFPSFGRMIAHLCLHGGPTVYGISPALMP